MENVYLVGSESVDRAGSAMRSAASEVQSAASSLSHTAQSIIQALERHQQAMADWLDRFEAALRRSRYEGEARLSGDF